MIIKNLGAKPDATRIALIEKNSGFKLLYTVWSKAVFSICRPVQSLSLS
jgi:hypothetical protein